MRIVINGRFLAQRITGVQRVAIELTKELDKLVKRGEMVLAVPTDTTKTLELRNIEVIRVGGRSSNKWVQWDLYRFAKKNKACILTFSGLGSFLQPDYFFAHDVTFRRFPESFEKKFRIMYGLFFGLCLKRCKRVFTVSEFSKSELLTLYGLNADVVTVIYNSYGVLDAKIQIENIEKFGLKKDEYYITIGSINIHKNQSYIVDLARKNPDKKFAIVGMKDGKSFNGVNIDDLDNISSTGFVSDCELASLYHYAKGFIFPSLYEGFGIPPLEAISNNCKRVAVSDIPVLREIYSRGAYFFNPYKVDEFNFEAFDKCNVEAEKLYYIRKFKWKTAAQKVYEYLFD